MDKIGRYRLDRRLGAGSFATVWLGHDDDLDIPVAGKVLAENWAANDDVGRFLTEARIMRRITTGGSTGLRHPTLEDGRPYFVMDFIDGSSMNDMRKQLIDGACAAIVRGGLPSHRGLHNNDVIHRDVTPGNLLLSHTPSGETQVLIADLGVAKSMVDVAGATDRRTPSYGNGLSRPPAAGRWTAGDISPHRRHIRDADGRPPHASSLDRRHRCAGSSVTPPIAERLGARRSGRADGVRTVLGPEPQAPTAARLPTRWTGSPHRCSPGARRP